MNDEKLTFHSVPMPFLQALVSVSLVGTVGTGFVVGVGLLDPRFAEEATLWVYLGIAAVPFLWGALSIFGRNAAQRGLSWIVRETGVEIRRGERLLGHFAVEDLLLVEKKKEWLPRWNRPPVAVLTVYGRKGDGKWFSPSFRIVLSVADADPLAAILDGWIRQNETSPEPELPEEPKNEDPS